MKVRMREKEETEAEEGKKMEMKVGGGGGREGGLEHEYCKESHDHIFPMLIWLQPLSPFRLHR